MFSTLPCEKLAASRNRLNALMFRAEPSCQRMHLARQSAARQQVDAPAPQLARTGAGQQKPQPLRLDQPMHFIEQLGHALDFIDHNPALVALWNLLPEALRGSQ